MQYSLLTFLILVSFSACTQEKSPALDGQALLVNKCASCHNLDMPPKTFEDEKAPPMMAVAFHVKDFMPSNSPSDKKPKFIAFFQDFVLNPSKEKSFCDKESLKSYGLMPSMKGHVNKEELYAIADYAFDFYDQKKFLRQMQEKAAFDVLPKGQQLATKKECLTCHGIQKAKAAPAFTKIAKNSKSEIVKSIMQGSKGKYKGFERMPMPAFANRLTKEEIEILTEWIKSQSK